MNFKVYCSTYLVISLSILSIIGCSSIGQRRQQPLSGQNNKTTLPTWATMIDDPNVNYNEAVATFDSFWKGKTRPLQEEDEFGGVENEEKERENEEHKKKLGKNDPAALYGFEYKRFKNWQREVVNYVQPDGRILSADERIELWKKEQELKKAQEKK
jgi:hypothetical protein